MKNQQKSREPDDSEIGLDSFAAMNRPERQIISQIAERQNAIYDKDDGYLADVNSPVDSAEDEQDLGLERGTYVSENKNDAKCTIEHDIGAEEPLKSPDVPTVKKATGKDFMEIRDLKFSCSIVGDSIPFFFIPRTAPAHSTPLVSIRLGKQCRNPPKEPVGEDDEYWRKNARSSNLEDERKQSERQLHQNAQPSNLEDERKQSQRQLHQIALPSNLEDERKQTHLQLHQNAQPSNLEDETKESQRQLHQIAQPSNLEDERKQSQRQLHQKAQPSYLEDQRKQSRREWYRSRKARSKAIGRTSSWLKTMALYFTIITVLFIILLIELLNL